MSRSVDLFIASDLPLDDLAGLIASRCEVQLSADPAHDRWVLREGDLRAALTRHRYVDDGELLLSHFPYALSAMVAAGRPQDSVEAAMLRRIGHRLQEADGCSVLLVLDLQYRDAPGGDSGPGGDGAPGADDPPGGVGGPDGDGAPGRDGAPAGDGAPVGDGAIAGVQSVPAGDKS
jgi:hypothetical protein